MADTQNHSLNTKELRTDNLESEVLQATGLKMIDFWAEWCGPCRVLGPKVGAIADKYANDLGVYKLNADHHPEVAARYGIRGLPTVLFFRDGRVVDQVVGAVPQEILEQVIQKHLA